MQSAIALLATLCLVAPALSTSPAVNCPAQAAQVKASNARGAWIPQCEADGSYKALQSHGSTGMAFCVTPTGRKVSEPARDLKNCTCPLQKDEASPPRGTNAPMRVGQFVPKCETDGTFSAMQFHGSTGYTKCFTPEGVEVKAERGLKGCKCLIEKHEGDANAEAGNIGGFVPSCEEDGTYSKRQASGSTGYTWCVDAEGKDVGERVAPGSDAKLDC